MHQFLSILAGTGRDFHHRTDFFRRRPHGSFGGRESASICVMVVVVVVPKAPYLFIQNGFTIAFECKYHVQTFGLSFLSSSSSSAGSAVWVQAIELRHRFLKNGFDRRVPSSPPRSLGD